MKIFFFFISNGEYFIRQLNAGMVNIDYVPPFSLLTLLLNIRMYNFYNVTIFRHKQIPHVGKSDDNTYAKLYIFHTSAEYWTFWKSNKIIRSISKYIFSNYRIFINTIQGSNMLFYNELRTRISIIFILIYRIRKMMQDERYFRLFFLSYTYTSKISLSRSIWNLHIPDSNHISFFNFI